MPKCALSLTKEPTSIVRILFAALVVASSATFAGADPPADFALAELAEGVFVHHGRQASWASAGNDDVANLGFIVGRDCVAVIDTGGSPRVGRGLRDAIARHTQVPVCYVINTHAHPDHVLGNSAFRGGDNTVRFVAHARMAASLGARGPFYLNALARDIDGTTDGDGEILVYPDTEVADTLELDLGGRMLSLTAWPTSHTDHDLSVLDQRTGVLFAGDLLFVGHLPVLDGRLVGWLQTMEKLKALNPVKTVPGHGSESTDLASAIAPQQRYLDTLLTRTREAITNGKTISEAVASIEANADDGWLLVDDYHRRNVTAAFAELEWE